METNSYVSVPTLPDGTPCEIGAEVWRLADGRVEQLTVRAVGDRLDGEPAVWCANSLGVAALYAVSELEGVEPPTLDGLMANCSEFINDARARALVRDAYALGARDAELRLKEGR